MNFPGATTHGMTGNIDGYMHVAGFGSHINFLHW